MAATGRFFAMGFREGQRLETTQKHALGELGLDERGNVWSYVEFTTAVSPGQWVMDREETITAARIVSTGDQSDHDYFQIATGQTALTDAFVLEGSYGTITGGGAHGNAFVLDEISADRRTGHVKMLTDGAQRVSTDSTWSADFNSTTAIALACVGSVQVGDDDNVGRARGVAQYAVSADQASNANPRRRAFGWVLQQGIGVALMDRTAANNPVGIGNSRVIYLEDSGNFDGGTVGGTAVPGGRALADYPDSGTDDRLVLADIQIVNTASRWGAPPSLPLGYGSPAIQ